MPVADYIAVAITDVTVNIIVAAVKGWTIWFFFWRGGGGGGGWKNFFVQHYFFSLASVSFYCEGCAGNFFLKSSTRPLQKSNGPPLTLLICYCHHQKNYHCQCHYLCYYCCDSFVIITIIVVVVIVVVDTRVEVLVAIHSRKERFIRNGLWVQIIQYGY